MKRGLDTDVIRSSKHFKLMEPQPWNDAWKFEVHSNYLLPEMHSHHPGNASVLTTMLGGSYHVFE